MNFSVNKVENGYIVRISSPDLRVYQDEGIHVFTSLPSMQIFIGELLDETYKPKESENGTEQQDLFGC